MCCKCVITPACRSTFNLVHPSSPKECTHITLGVSGFNCILSEEKKKKKSVITLFVRRTTWRVLVHPGVLESHPSFYDSFFHLFWLCFPFVFLHSFLLIIIASVVKAKWIWYVSLNWTLHQQESMKASVRVDSWWSTDDRLSPLI